MPEGCWQTGGDLGPARRLAGARPARGDDFHWEACRPEHVRDREERLHLVLGLKRLIKADRTQKSPELVAVLDQSLNEKSDITDLLDLADLFKDISALGEPERKACMQVLKVFADYRRSLRRGR